MLNVVTRLRLGSDTSDGELSVDDGQEQVNDNHSEGVRVRKLYGKQSQEEKVIEVNDCDYFYKIGMLIIAGMFMFVLLLISSKRE